VAKAAFFSFLLVVSYGVAIAQTTSLFNNQKYMLLVEEGADHVYSGDFDSALVIIDSLATFLPKHPVIPMMKAMNLAWQDQPMNSGSAVFEEHESYLQEVILLSKEIKKKEADNIEALFFEMSARGLLAEYYAEEGSNFKAMSEARQTYSMIKRAMEIADQSPEFFFLSGLYNYFREKYPERHPIYKPVVWVFASGDISLGLSQLDSAVHRSKIVAIEAHLYLSYIYLRYENDPQKAKYYLQRLYEKYPTNAFFKAKFLECLIRIGELDAAQVIIDQLLLEDKPYYKMCGLIYQGLVMEKRGQGLSFARQKYEEGLEEGKQCLRRGWYYRTEAYLGLGRIASKTGHQEKATYYFEKVIDLDESDALTEEAELRLNDLN
jgi:tetratricopeptide (TPR) repeat protein